MSLTSIYGFAAIHATLKVKATSLQIRNAPLLKLFFTLTFLLITGLSFANRRTLMGFDIMTMAVPVMQPTILQGDKFLVDTWAYEKSLPKRGDIVAHSFNGQQGLYLNRIIAVANDLIEIESGKVFLNGQVLNEPYILFINVTRPQSKDMKALIIPQGNYFVMGDNRDASFGDSRFSGTITIDNIVGKTTDIISSQDKSRIGTTLK
jgi:signal peptidase I